MDGHGCSPAVDLSVASSDSTEKEMTRAQKKNALKHQKRREKKNKKQQAAATTVESTMEGVVEAMETMSVSTSEAPPPPPPPLKGHDNDQEMAQEDRDREVLKRTRNIRKKLKQIEDLERRIASGEIAKPDKDQLGKITKKEDFLEELEELEAS